MSYPPQRQAPRSPGRALARRTALALLVIVAVVSGSMVVPDVRSRVRALVRPAPPPQITPLALSAPPRMPPSVTPSQPSVTPSQPSVTPSQPSVTPQPSATPQPTSERRAITSATATATSEPTPSTTPTAAPTPTSGPVEVNGRRFDAYIPAATKPHQFYQYSCEFDAAWVILATYGLDIPGDDLITHVDHDRSIEPYIQETRDGFVIHGGDIRSAYSGDYTKNFLARSTGTAMRKLFERYGFQTTLVSDRPGVEAALRRGALVWMKTTVDFNTWRPATWIMPDGTTHRTVLGNDHAVVAMGYSERGVVIRDVLGPTSTNRQRPYEYEVDWPTFMAAWEAQSFDGLAVAPPQRAQP